MFFSAVAVTREARAIVAAFSVVSLAVLTLLFVAPLTLPTLAAPVAAYVAVAYRFGLVGPRQTGAARRTGPGAAALGMRRRDLTPGPSVVHAVRRPRPTTGGGARR